MVGKKETSETSGTKDTTKAIRRSWGKAKVKVKHLTGRPGITDPLTGLEVAEGSNQPIQAARDRAEREKDEAEQSPPR